MKTFLVPRLNDRGFHVLDGSLDLKVGEIVFAYDGLDVFAWLSITEFDPSRSQWIASILMWSYDGEL